MKNGKSAKNFLHFAKVTVLSVLLLSFILPLFAASSLGADVIVKKLNVSEFTDKDLWSASDGVSPATRALNGKKVMYFPLSSAKGDIVLDFTPEGRNLSEMTEMYIGVVAGDDTEFTLTAKVISKTDGKTFSKEFTGVFSSHRYIYVPVTGVKEDCEITLSVSGDHPSYIIVTEIGFDNGSYGMFSEKFSASDFIYESGTATPYQDGVGVTPTLGHAAISPVFTEDTTADGVYLVWVSAEGCTGGTVGIIAENISGESVDTSSSVSLSSGRHTYTFIIYAPFSSVTFVFDGVGTAGQTSAFLLTDGGVKRIGDREGTAVGTVDSCKFSENEVTLTGSLFAEAAAEYVSYDLEVYVTPIWEYDGDLSEKKPAATQDFSTKFEITVSPSEYYAACLYTVVLSDAKTKIPVGSPVFADSGALSAKEPVTVCALEGADTADMFKANVSTAIFELDLDSLVSSGDIYSTELFSFGGDYYYYGTDKLYETDKMVSFCKAAGIDVYLRLIGDSVLGFDVTDRDSVNSSVAVCAFLSERYTDVAGFILGENTVPESDAAETAFGISVLGESLRGETDRAVAVPFSPEGEMPVFAASLAYHMAQYKTGKNVLLCTYNSSAEETVRECEHLLSSASAIGYSYAASAVIYTPKEELSNEQIAEEYLALCKSADFSGERFAVLNVKRCSDASLFESLCDMTDREGIFRMSVTKVMAFENYGEFSSYVPLWDFGKAYDTFGWTAGGGAFSRAETDESKFSAGRVLHVYGDEGAAGSGIIIRRFNNETDLCGLCAKFDLTVSGDDGEDAEVTVTFGREDSKAEYTATAECNIEASLFCDLSQYEDADRVEYVSLTVRSKKPTALEVSEISVGTDDPAVNIDEKLKTGAADETNPVLYAAVLIFAAVTAIILSNLFRISSKNKNKHR